MQENHASPEISAEEWGTEFDKLAAISAQTELDVQVRWQFGSLHAKAFQPVVHEKTQLQFLLQRQSDSGLADGYIDISLPIDHPRSRGRYEKHVSQSGDVCLKVQHELVRLGADAVDAWTEVYLSTSPELLQLVTGEGRKQ